jgi:hypothetical protein
MNRSVADRFWSKVEKGDGCWLWKGGTSRGYGEFHLNRKTAKAYRVSWQLANGRDIPEEMDVLHRCNNRLCVRPDHLYLGTQKENMKDLFATGYKAVNGERNGAHKLTAQQVKEIRVASLSPHWGLFSELGREYGVSFNTIKDTVNRKWWRHLP